MLFLHCKRTKCPVLHNCFSQRPTKAYISTKFVVDVIPYKDKIPTELVVEGVSTKLVWTTYNSESCTWNGQKENVWVVLPVTNKIPMPIILWSIFCLESRLSISFHRKDAMWGVYLSAYKETKTGPIQLLATIIFLFTHILDTLWNASTGFCRHRFLLFSYW